MKNASRQFKRESTGQKKPKKLAKPRRTKCRTGSNLKECEIKYYVKHKAIPWLIFVHYSTLCHEMYGILLIHTPIVCLILNVLLFLSSQILQGWPQHILNLVIIKRCRPQENLNICWNEAQVSFQKDNVNNRHQFLNNLTSWVVTEWP